MMLLASVFFIGVVTGAVAMLIAIVGGIKDDYKEPKSKDDWRLP